MELFPVTLAFLAVEIVFVAMVVLSLFHFRRTIGLTPLFLFIGSHQYLQTVLAATVYLPLFGGYSTSPGSSVLFTSSLFAILLVYVREDVPQTRQMIYGIVLTNAVLTVLSLITDFEMRSGIVLTLQQIPPDFFRVNPRIFLAGTVVLLLDALLVIVLYEFLYLRLRVTSLYARVFGSLMTVVYFDSVAFSVLAFGGKPIFRDVLGGQLIGKTISGSAFATLLFIYLRFVDEKKASERTPGEPHDIFSILTYRERYEQVRTEKEEQARRHDLAIRESEQRYRSLFDGSHEAIALVDEDTMLIVRANAAMAALFDCTVEELVGRSLADVLGLSDSQDLTTPSRELHEFIQLTIPRGDGTGSAVELIGSAHLERGHRMLQFYFRDVTARIRAEEQLKHDAFHDRLTGLPNRALFMDRLNRLLLSRQRRAFALVFLDLDRFKNVNDSLGHIVGDALLVQVSGRMLASVRDGDSIARLGGDEFGLILDGIGTPAEAYLALRRLERLFEEPFIVGPNALTISVSCGVVLRSDEYERSEEMLRDADTAMYRAKADGRAQHAMFDESMRRSVVDFLSLESGLRTALSLNQIEVHYQPIFNLSSGRVAGVEALARWNRGDRMVGPSEFIPVAEETGLIASIGQFVLGSACAQAARWQNTEAGDLFVAVNLSARQFQTETLRQMIKDELTRSGLEPRLLQIEITESVLMDSTDRTLAILEDLRRLGVTFAIDDFGTGWSSLSYLEKLPIDMLKIDRSFVHGISNATDPAPIPAAIVSLASSLGIHVVAEGIETEAQLSKLRGMSCEFGQGFLLARPAPPDQVERLLRGGGQHPLSP